ncbi:hypothetical protein BD414DRAFT_476521 [Trametes punicea]|nr:hypothetical protein BD414DRAFT_476521 [Trametes punicea]
MAMDRDPAVWHGMADCHRRDEGAPGILHVRRYRRRAISNALETPESLHMMAASINVRSGSHASSPLRVTSSAVLVFIRGYALVPLPATACILCFHPDVLYINISNTFSGSSSSVKSFHIPRLRTGRSQVSQAAPGTVYIRSFPPSLSYETHSQNHRPYPQTHHRMRIDALHTSLWSSVVSVRGYTVFMSLSFPLPIAIWVPQRAPVCFRRSGLAAHAVCF